MSEADNVKWLKMDYSNVLQEKSDLQAKLEAAEKERDHLTTLFSLENSQKHTCEQRVRQLEDVLQFIRDTEPQDKAIGTLLFLLKWFKDLAKQVLSTASTTEESSALALVERYPACKTCHPPDVWQCDDCMDGDGYTEAKHIGEANELITNELSGMHEPVQEKPCGTCEFEFILKPKELTRYGDDKNAPCSSCDEYHPLASLRKWKAKGVKS